MKWPELKRYVVLYKQKSLKHGTKIPSGDTFAQTGILPLSHENPSEYYILNCTVLLYKCHFTKITVNIIASKKLTWSVHSFSYGELWNCYKKTHQEQLL